MGEREITFTVSEELYQQMKEAQAVYAVSSLSDLAQQAVEEKVQAAQAETDADAAALMDLLSELNVVVPRLVILEAARNLSRLAMDKQFFATIRRSNRFQIVDEPIPETLVLKYVALGLPDKADAFIGAFAEWIGVQYLVSDNRHFLNLSTKAFAILRPGEFLERFHAGTL
jgi:hypothetical protein